MMDTTTNDTMGHICMKGDVDALRDFLGQQDNDVDLTLAVSWTDADGTALTSPPLFIGIDYGHRRLVDELLEAGADVTSTDDNDYTPAQWAAWKGQLDILKSLIGRGATVDQDALDLALSENDAMDPVVELIRQNMDPYAALAGDEDEIMMKACREGDADKVTAMISAGYDYSKWKTEEDGKYQLFSPMNMAVKRGHFDIVQLFMDEGVRLQLGNEGEATTEANS